MELSISRINNFVGCPYSLELFYKYGIVSTKWKDAAEMGTAYHKLHEVAVNAEQDGTNVMEAVAAVINEKYEHCPSHKTVEEWEKEQALVTYGFLAYHWFYDVADFEIIKAEVPFYGVPILDSEGNDTGHTLKGRIDNLIRMPNGHILIHDFKTTSHDLTSGSYWTAQQNNMQMRTYLYAARCLQSHGVLEEFGIGKDEIIFGAMIDVWKKPGISPKFITQKDTKLLVEGGQYYSNDFKVEWTSDLECRANGVITQVKMGAKGAAYAIRETPDMYGARLIHVMTEDPDMYFARRNVPITDRDMALFQDNLAKIVRTIDFMNQTDNWYNVKTKCRETYTCDYTGICDADIDISQGILPEGFKCIFDKE